MPQLPTGHVFISYSRKDNDVMQRIVQFLQIKGIKIWLDNEKLVAGTPAWEKEIEKAIASAYAVIVIMSPDSNDSEWVPREISFADKYDKRIFPLLVRGDERSAISLRLTGRQYVDLRINEVVGLNSFHTELAEYLKQRGSQKEKELTSAEEIQLYMRRQSVQFVGKWVVTSITSDNGKPIVGTFATVELHGEGYDLRFWDSPFVWYLSGEGETITGVSGPRSFSLTVINQGEAIQFSMKGGGSDKRAILKKIDVHS